jgi:monoamine oxidase
MTDTQVVIIGAGFSGIGAAKELHESGIDFVVIEAGDQIGGRAKSTTFGDYTVELGANWIHSPYSTNGDSHNTIWLYKELLEIEGSWSNWNNYKSRSASNEKNNKRHDGDLRRKA